MPVETQTESLTPAALSAETIAKLALVPILQSLTPETLHCLDGATERHLPAEQILQRQGEDPRVFWILLSGTIRILTSASDGHETMHYVMQPGTAFGEVALLANIPSAYSYRSIDDCDLLELDEEQFWRLMTTCPEVRKAILGNMAMRLAKMQAATIQQDKMASLGTLAAGLMHELNNPGSAARRAAAQLRANFERMHRLTATWASADLSTTQKSCMFQLQDKALNSPRTLALSTIQQSDAEEHFAEWLEDAHVDDAWSLAPSFVSIGLTTDDLACARSLFEPALLTNSLSWLDALVSNTQLVSTIEDSVTRVTDLIKAVKKYAYEGRGETQSIDLNDSIHATLVILGHKIREKQLSLSKDFGPGLPPLESACQGLNQIWTNLLDNAIDAAPQQGALTIRTWSEQIRQSPTGQPLTDLCILVADNGAGIPLEIQPRIFDPFYTTKPVGVGTGLGLGIVYRIVEQYGGTIHFTSAPGDTEFVVRLPTTH